MENTFKIGDMVIMTREPTNEEWKCVGKIDIPKEYFDTPHKVTRLSQKANAIILDNGYAYPSCCFQLASSDSLYNVQAQKGDVIEVINTRSAHWVKEGWRYSVLDVNEDNDLRLDTMSEYYWSCEPHDYKVVHRPYGESTFDAEALLKQQRRIAKEKALQKAGKHYHAGVKFKSMQTGDVYTVADKPGYEWSENTEGIYLWGINTSGTDLRVYISKRGDWAEIIYKDLLAEAKEKFPPGTKFTNPYGSISVIDDNPEYSLASSNVYAKCITGRRVTICTAGKWADIVSRPSDRTYGPAIVTSTPKSHFNVGDVVEVIERTDFFNVGHVSTVERADGTTVLMANHTGDSWFINNTKVKHHTVPTRKIKLDLPTLSKEELTGLQEYFYPQTKTNTNGTESKQSVKLQGINLKIREGNSVRGIGLKGSGSKVKLGSDYSYN